MFQDVVYFSYYIDAVIWYNACSKLKKKKRGTGRFVVDSFIKVYMNK